MQQDEELHEKLLYAFRQYFEANQRWLNKGTKRAGMDVRHWLNEIRKICSARRKVIMDWRYELNEEMAKKKAQKQQASGDSDTN